MSDTKQCALCGLDLPISKFGHDGRTRDRLTYRCNTCRAMQTQLSTAEELEECQRRWLDLFAISNRQARRIAELEADNAHLRSIQKG